MKTDPGNCYYPLSLLVAVKAWDLPPYSLAAPRSIKSAFFSFSTNSKHHTIKTEPGKQYRFFKDQKD
ncbi:hypothetical protein V6N13_027582 [Hibiscus sabdariffa]